jgi:hypothetical protein
MSLTLTCWGSWQKTNDKCLTSAFLLFELLLSITPSFRFACNLSDKQFFNANLRNSTFGWTPLIGTHYETYVGSALVMPTKHFTICTRWRCVSSFGNETQGKPNTKFMLSTGQNLMLRRTEALCLVLGTTLRQEPAGVSFIAKCLFTMITYFNLWGFTVNTRLRRKPCV